MQEVDDSAYWSDLEGRSAAAIREIPVDRIHVFCASCAERFFAGYVVWLAKERLVTEPAASLPSPQFVRRSIDLCWAAGVRAEAESLLETLIRTMPGDNEQPIFKSPLDDYFVEPWLLRLGLSSVLDSFRRGHISFVPLRAASGGVTAGFAGTLSPPIRNTIASSAAAPSLHSRRWPSASTIRVLPLESKYSRSTRRDFNLGNFAARLTEPFIRSVSSKRYSTRGFGFRICINCSN